MKHVVLILVAAIIAFFYFSPTVAVPIGTGATDRQPHDPGRYDAEQSDQIIGDAFSSRKSDLQVQGSGTVIRVLADDTVGSRHQRFILKLRSGQTLLIAHNIDLAPRIPGLRKGDEVAFYGEYEWNEKGGVVHWTHHDPARKHVGGWLRHEGNTYE